MGSITDTVTVTELSRLTGKSRPTIYKWITLYETCRTGELPPDVAELFDMIAERGHKKDIYRFCDERFSADCNGVLGEVLELLRTNSDKLDINKIKRFIEEEIKNG